MALARSWIGARYHHMARVRPSHAEGEKGATDCAQLLACVYQDAGLIDAVPLDYYPPDWHLHRGLERYLAVVLAHARETDSPLPGDVVLYKWGRCFAHGAIVVDPGWPQIVHAIIDARAVILDRGDGGRLRDREKKFFTLW
ncbi:MAG TPA: hydrolase [Alphaproteobacteria bacterium]|nr:hydrolase [Alphaproteobacteria bacterium]